MPSFSQYIGIDYSGAEAPTSRLKGLQVYMASPGAEPVKVGTPAGRGWKWTRKELAGWLLERLLAGGPVLVGIDHGFSFPMAYFERHGLAADWPAFLDDFREHWPTDDDHTCVDFVRDGIDGNAAARSGDARWRRLTELRVGSAKSVFHFDVPGSVAKSTHAGLPWLRYLHQKAGGRVHFWPFDGFEVPAGRSVLAEVYPRILLDGSPRDGRSDHEHDAWTVARWLKAADESGVLAGHLAPALTAEEKRLAGVEGWILGVA
ncbi:MAG TPA: hypothetical protein PK280_08310 [Planctomycetota bacterium]|nr:hypothetical protein [Planctomycetota bacterium]